MLNIDQIVRQVLFDLKDGTQKCSALEIAPDEIYVADKVISLETIKRQTSTKLFISPKSIITPSAKDEIKKRHIKIAVKMESKDTAAKHSDKTFYIAELQSAKLPANIHSRLRKAFAFEIKNFDTVERIINEIKQKTDACSVIFTDKPATVLQKLNRCETIRAITGSEVPEIIEDAKETNANVLVLRLGRIAEVNVFSAVSQFFSR